MFVKIESILHNLLLFFSEFLHFFFFLSNLLPTFLLFLYRREQKGYMKEDFSLFLVEIFFEDFLIKFPMIFDY